MKSNIKFADLKVKDSFISLSHSDDAGRQLRDWIVRAREDIQENCFCGIRIKKELIPEIYIRKYCINNLWKYDLPRGWRLMYSISGGEVEIIAIILEWLSHKEYEKRFKY